MEWSLKESRAAASPGREETSFIFLAFCKVFLEVVILSCSQVVLNFEANAVIGADLSDYIIFVHCLNTANTLQ